MKRKFVTLAALLCGMMLPAAVQAGGLVTNTNQHVRFLRMFAVDASTGTDAVYANPAGTAFMDDGFYLAITSQTVKQTRTITAGSQLYENGEKEFKGKTFVPVYPQIDAAWKTGRWNFSMALSVIGGGGKCEFNDGIPMFETSIAAIPALLTAKGIPTTRYSVDSYMNGEQYVWTAQLGAARLLNDNFSVYGGLRFNYVQNIYDGYIRNIQINPLLPGVNPNADMISATAFFAALSASMAESNPAMSQLAAGYAAATQDMEVDVTQTGFGITPIVGVDFKKDRWNVGVKWELNTDVEVENSTDKNTLPAGKKEAYDDGVKADADIPGLLTVGVQYELRDNLRTAVGYHHYFDTDAHRSGYKLLDHGINEYLAGVEWDCTERLTLSCGGQYTQDGATDAYQSDLSFSLSSCSLGLGGAYRISERTRVSAGYFCTLYEAYDVAYDNYNSTGLPGSNSFDRTSHTVGVGVDFKF